MTKQTEAPRAITLTTNTILNGRFYVAGAVLPVARIEDLPEPLQPLVVTGEPEADEEADQPRGSFDLNTPYLLTSDGRLGRAVRRQVAELEAAAEQEEWLEEQMDSPLPPEIAADLEDEHHKHVGLQAAQLGAAARMSDDIADGAAAAAEPPVLFVKRGEPVFMKDPDGSFQFIGTTDSRADLPDPPTIIP